MKISDIIYNIDNNYLFVPAFQREYVWNKDDAKRLIYSLLNEYPTGTLLTWETNNPPELKGDYSYESSKGKVKLILDGQQRITTLYMLVTGTIPPYYTDADIKNDIRQLYVNIETLSLEYYKKISMQVDPSWVRLTETLNGSLMAYDVIDEIKNKDEEIPDESVRKIYKNFELLRGVPSRSLLEQTVPSGASTKEAIDIFYIVNASGVSMTMRVSPSTPPVSGAVGEKTRRSAAAVLSTKARPAAAAALLACLLFPAAAYGKHSICLNYPAYVSHTLIAGYFASNTDTASVLWPDGCDYVSKHNHNQHSLGYTFGDYDARTNNTFCKRAIAGGDNYCKFGSQSYDPMPADYAPWVEGFYNLSYDKSNTGSYHSEECSVALDDLDYDTQILPSLLFLEEYIRGAFIVEEKTDRNGVSYNGVFRCIAGVHQAKETKEAGGSLGAAAALALFLLAFRRRRTAAL